MLVGDVQAEITDFLGHIGLGKLYWWHLVEIKKKIVQHNFK